jgi:hypothetical protein
MPSKAFHLICFSISKEDCLGMCGNDKEKIPFSSLSDNGIEDERKRRQSEKTLLIQLLCDDVKSFFMLRAAWVAYEKSFFSHSAANSFQQEHNASHFFLFCIIEKWSAANN